MKYSVAMTEKVFDELRRHLSRLDGQEDVAFAVWHASQGHERRTALLEKVVLPGDNDREVHGNASYKPAFLERAIDVALADNGGLAFLHSHPATGWQDMSADDIVAEQQRLAPTVLGATEMPLVGLTLAARDGVWSARVWERVGPKKYSRHWCESVRVVGEGLSISFNDRLLRPAGHRTSQDRTRAAWGPEAHANLARLKIGVVGLGSVGSIVAEALARTGVQRLKMIDFQTIEEVNLDRTLHAKLSDYRRRMSKVAVAARALRDSATADRFELDECEFSVCEEPGYRRALDCDVLFSCVDRPWARSVLNFIAYAHLIPVIDGGILVSRTKEGQLRGASWKAHVVGPSYRCMRCLGQYESGLVETDKNGDLDDPSYLEALPREDLARTNENVFGFSLGAASLEFLQFIMLTIQPLGLKGGRPQNYHLVTGEIDLNGTVCDSGCVFPSLIAAGETRHAGIGVHAAAEAARKDRAAQKWRRWLPRLR